MKKIFTLLLLALTITVVAQDVRSLQLPEIYKGTCGASEDGKNLTWIFNPQSGKLLIWGEGQMKISSIKERPWFQFRDSIMSIEIKEGVTSIGAWAFYGCTNLESVTFPQSLRKIYSKAFAQTKLESVTIGPLDMFGSAVFQFCRQLKSVTFEGDVKQFGLDNFDGCTNLEHVVLPKNTDYTGCSNFRQCNKLPIINDIRYADTYLVEAAVKDKKSYVIKSGTKLIEEFAFSKCDQMETITIPATVTDIGGRAFKDCVGLKYITCLAVEPPNTHFTGYTELVFLNVDCSKITLYVPSQSVEAYKKDYEWGQFKIVGMQAKGTK